MEPCFGLLAVTDSTGIPYIPECKGRISHSGTRKFYCFSRDIKAYRVCVFSGTLSLCSLAILIF